MSNSFATPRDYSPLGSSVTGISQARILEWAAISPPGDIPDPEVGPVSPDWQVDSLPLSHLEAPTHITGYKVEVPQVPQILLHETKSASKFLKDLNASLSFSDTETMDNK